MARDIDDEFHYVAHGREIPVKRTAPEVHKIDLAITSSIVYYYVEVCT